MSIQIPKQYAHVKDQSLIIVVSILQGIFYRIAEGRMEAVRSFEVPKTLFTDREGFFAHSGRGHATRSGAVREPQDVPLKTEFLKRFRHEIKQEAKTVELSDVFVFVIAPYKRDTLASLPKVISSRVRECFVGDHLKDHPLMLLNVIAKSIEDHRPRKFVKPEAKKLLEKKVGLE